MAVGQLCCSHGVVCQSIAMRVVLINIEGGG